MKRILTILAINLLFAVAAAAQGTVRGTVFDDANGEAVPFANVVLDGTKYGCATDLSGFFLINKIPYGTYKLRVRFVGYEDYTQDVTVSGSRPVTITIRLKPASQMLQEVVISDSKVEEQRMQTQVSV